VRVRIDVTQEDIEAGKRRKVTTCPIARAANRVFVKAARVNTFEIRVAGMHVFTGQPLPLRASRFVMAFDSGRPVKPFSFTIAGVPKEWVK
jgi:hypothetical protein